MFDLHNFLEYLIPFFHTTKGVFIFIPLYSLWVTLLLPGVWVSMLAGVIYGTWKGSLIVFLGALIGAEIAFVLGRSLFRDFIQKKLYNYPRIQAIQKSISGEGLKLIFLTRLSPVFPFSFLNFAYGLSEVSFRDYTIGLIGILPGTILFCSLGDLAGNLSQFGNVLSGNVDSSQFLIRIVGLLATIATFWLVVRASRNALKDFNS